MAAGGVRPQGLGEAALVVGDHGVGAGEDDRCRAVVDLQPHHAAGHPLVGEAQDVADVGPTPRVQRLLDVGVLVLVDVDVPEAAGDVAPVAFIALQRLDHPQQEIAKVRQIVLAQDCLVRRVHPGGRCDILRNLVSPVLRSDPSGDGRLVGRDSFVLHGGDGGRGGVHGVAVVVTLDAGVFHRDADGPARLCGVGDLEPFGEAGEPGALGQQAAGDGMEGADPDLARAFLADHLRQPVLHDLRGVFGEGQRQDLIGACAPLRDQMGDAGSQGFRLAGAGSGEHQQGAVQRRGRLALLVIQAAQGISAPPRPTIPVEHAAFLPPLRCLPRRRSRVVRGFQHGGLGGFEHPRALGPVATSQLCPDASHWRQASITVKSSAGCDIATVSGCLGAAVGAVCLKFHLSTE